MNHFSHYRFHRTDPQPWIPFSTDPTTTRGDIAVLWVSLAGLLMIIAGVI